MKRYRVSVIESLCWSTYVYAESKEHAEGIAQGMWESDGPEAFKCTDNDVDGIIADEAPRQQ